MQHPWLRFLPIKEAKKSRKIARNGDAWILPFHLIIFSPFIYIYIYIYIEREREREREAYWVWLLNGEHIKRWNGSIRASIGFSVIYIYEPTWCKPTWCVAWPTSKLAEIWLDPSRTRLRADLNIGAPQKTQDWSLICKKSLKNCLLRNLNPSNPKQENTWHVVTKPSLVLFLLTYIIIYMTILSLG